ncbi:OLC1v1037007C1 [Oldenlandia corymbosa var. corymbosa]|uniref:OLC1v1037007C1 n=1 Tax=Oldenlandia corymbosa var. corymbosa TaxID=529605 RepID=A0AAV1CZX6_OLDCO|nr:OLC1v1037007C1 [Oldenlandia corymbosa var. corymbosa]
MNTISSCSSRTCWNPQNPSENILENPNPNNHNPIHLPTENIHWITNSVQPNKSMGSSSSSGEGSSRQSRVSRRARSRAPWHDIYQTRERVHSGASSNSSWGKLEPKKCRCIEKILADGPIMPFQRNCPVHESYWTSDLSMLTPLIPPPPPPAFLHWMYYGPVLTYQYYSEGFVPAAPWYPTLHERLYLQRPQGSTIASTLDWDWNLLLPTQPPSFQVPEPVPNPDFETRNWLDFNLESLTRGTGNASSLGINPLVHEQSIQSFDSITTPVVSTTSVNPHDEIYEITQEVDHQLQWGNLNADINQMAPFSEIEHAKEPAQLVQFDEELNAIIYEDRVNDYNNEALKISLSIPSSSSGHGPTNCQNTARKRTNYAVDGENNHKEEVGGSHCSTKPNDIFGLGNEGITKMHLEMETTFASNDDSLLEEDEFLDLVNWPDHQSMVNTERFEFDV